MYIGLLKTAVGVNKQFEVTIVAYVWHLYQQHHLEKKTLNYYGTPVAWVIPSQTGYVRFTDV